jgi:hypothetical protein
VQGFFRTAASPAGLSTASPNDPAADEAFQLVRLSLASRVALSINIITTTIITIIIIIIIIAAHKVDGGQRAMSC